MESSQARYGQRFDYAKFNVEVEYDRIPMMHESWQAAKFSLYNDGPLSGGEKMRIIRSRPNELHLVAFECWGPTADMVRFLDFGLWSQYCERLDIREGWFITDGAIETLHKVISANGVKNRNVTLYNSAIRERRDGRSAGGEGIAIGSHKSEYRVSVYRRGKEVGALEFQFRGDRMNSTIRSITDMQGKGYDAWDNDPWTTLRHLLWSKGYVEMEKVMGINGNTLLAIAHGKYTEETSTEQQLESIEKAIDALPPDALGAIYTAIQLKMFGEEPEGPVYAGG